MDLVGHRRADRRHPGLGPDLLGRSSATASAATSCPGRRPTTCRSRSSTRSCRSSSSRCCSSSPCVSQNKVTGAQRPPRRHRSRSTRSSGTGSSSTRRPRRPDGVRRSTPSARRAAEIPVLVVPTDRDVRFQVALRRRHPLVLGAGVPVQARRLPAATRTAEQRVPDHGPSRRSYVGRCAELCGTYHSQMNFEVRVGLPAAVPALPGGARRPGMDTARARWSRSALPGDATVTHPFDLTTTTSRPHADRGPEGTTADAGRAAASAPTTTGGPAVKVEALIFGIIGGVLRRSPRWCTASGAGARIGTTALILSGGLLAAHRRLLLVRLAADRRPARGPQRRRDRRGRR